jgi:hypothetical protein
MKEKSKHVGLAQQNGFFFGPAFFAQQFSLLRLSKGHIRKQHLSEKSVINMI